MKNCICLILLLGISQISYGQNIEQIERMLSGVSSKQWRLIQTTLRLSPSAKCRAKDEILKFYSKNYKIDLWKNHKIDLCRCDRGNFKCDTSIIWKVEFTHSSLISLTFDREMFIITYYSKTHDTLKLRTFSKGIKENDLEKTYVNP